MNLIIKLFYNGLLSLLARLRKFKNIIAKADNTDIVTANKAMTARLYPWVKGELGSPKQTAQNTIYKAFIFLINCTQ